MKQIPLSQGLFALVDDADFEWLSQWKWHVVKTPDGRLYAARSAREKGLKKNISMHRFILGARPGEEVDHIYNNTLDNRRSQIRLVTPLQNTLNSIKRNDNTSGFRGVYWDSQRQKWVAQIRMKGVHRLLGRFSSKIEAAITYDDAALLEWGEFARVNFPFVYA